MAAQQPRVETALDTIWTPALARGLIRDDALGSMHCCDGYTDVLGPSVRSRRVRGRTRRPHWMFDYGRGAKSAHLLGEPRVLDVACGRGEVTRSIANQLSGNGFAIGLDESVSAIQRAARINSHGRAAYMRADPASLPFTDDTFDVVCCFAGLDRLQDPERVLAEMVRVLAPGGFVAVTARCVRESSPLQRKFGSIARAFGLRFFDHTAVTAFLTTAGFTDIEQQSHGFSQFVTARLPRAVGRLGAPRGTAR